MKKSFVVAAALAVLVVATPVFGGDIIVNVPPLPVVVNAPAGPQGVQGIQGIQGPQGPQGPAGISSVATVIVQAIGQLFSATSGGQGNVSVTAQCPQGYVVTGGGFAFGQLPTRLLMSAPSGSGGWRVFAASGNVNNDDTIFAYAICVVGTSTGP